MRQEAVLGACSSVLPPADCPPGLSPVPPQALPWTASGQGAWGLYRNTSASVSLSKRPA